MNEYQLPEEPAGPVWDQYGNKWVKVQETNPVFWKTDDDANGAVVEVLRAANSLLGN